MGSTFAMSAKQKYNNEALFATGRYSSDVLFTSTAVTSASCILIFTSFDVFLAWARVSIKLVSSKMLPFDSASSFNMDDSIELARQDLEDRMEERITEFDIKDFPELDQIPLGPSYCTSCVCKF